MRTRPRFTSLRRWIPMLVPVALVAGAWTYASGQMAFEPESKLWIEGTSTVRSFKCAATEMKGTVGYDGEIGPIEQVARAVNAVDVEIASATLDCKNDKMNSHMRKALKTGEFPTIGYRMLAQEITTGAEGALTATVKGILTLAGQEKEIPMTASVQQDADGRYRIAGSAELKMTEFGIKPPSLMLGTMKVHDKVLVRYEIVLNPSTVAVSSAR